MLSKELEMLQALPLEVKIMKSKLRIEEWIRYHGTDKCYISFSGGKDSTVLLDLVRSIDETIPAVFVDTGLEYPEIKQFVKEVENVTIVKPKMGFKEVINKYGYPVTSKEQAQYLHEIRLSTPTMVKRRLEGDEKGRFKLAQKWHYLINGPFPVSHKCCAIMKKNPIKKYERESGRVPFIGVMAYESSLRKQSYLKSGCNAFEGTRPTSTPLGFWTEQDILMYIKNNSLKIAEVYGDIIEVDGKLKTTKCDRTGCVFCGFGVTQEQSPNRYQRLEVTHPQLHAYCMNNLGFKPVLEFMNVEYTREKQRELER